MSEQEEEMTDEEVIKKIAMSMKDNTPTADEKQNVHTFLSNVIQTDNIEKSSKIGNLDYGQEGDLNELGDAMWTVRGSLEMARVSEKLMGNGFFSEYFNDCALTTLHTSLSKAGFLIRQGTTQTKQVADITKRKKVNKGWFGKEKGEVSGGDTTQS